MDRAASKQTISAEHRRLHRLLTLSRRALDGDNHDSLDYFQIMLENIRRELAGHFAAEDRGGSLDQAVSPPVFSPELRKVNGAATSI